MPNILTGECIDQLLAEGKTSLPIDTSTHWGLKSEMTGNLTMRATARPMREWPHTKRQTMFMSPVGLQHILSANVWAPVSVAFARNLSSELEAHADRRAIPELSTGFNRIGYNYMFGRPDRPAVIPPHIDPEVLLGTVAVVGIENGQEDNGVVVSPEAQLTLLACKNLCDARGVEQVMHQSTSRHFRQSITFAQMS